MDAKNDDSAGSDSLDKSLQKKCVVDDMGQGEGALPAVAGIETSAIQQQQNQCNASAEKKPREEYEHEVLPENSNKKQKTENSVGDGGGSGGGSADESSSTNENDVYLLTETGKEIPQRPQTKQHKQPQHTDAAPDREGGACCIEETTQSAQQQQQQQNAIFSHTATASASASAIVSNVTGTTAAAVTAVGNANAGAKIDNAAMKTIASTPAATTSTHNNNNNNNSNSHAFETKVKQISKDLKETTLAESANKKAVTATATTTATALEDTACSSTSSSSSSSSSSSFSSTSCDIEQNMTHSISEATATAVVDADARQITQNESTLLANLSSVAAGTESIDEQDHRSKKVRFHPDVKENDGGNRVIPKKKKKLKASSSALGDDEASTSTGIRSGCTLAEDEMELDEEEDALEEEEFNMQKTIAEAQDYLKSHPLTFVRPQDKLAGQVQSGLLDEEDLPQLYDSSEEEEDDVYENVPPESGVERILGKQIKSGKVEFLLRYADRPGLYWENKEWIFKHCPNLLLKYEENRDRRQERLMRHVAKRQNLRQRYTDF